jgi:hypothetical protein
VKKNRIAKLYVSGLSVKEVANKLDISESSVRRALRAFNIELRKTKFSKRLSDIDFQKACAAYQEGEPSTSIAKRVGVSPGSLIKRMRNNNIHIRPKSSYENVGGRKYYFDFDFFKSDSPAAAYIAGFLYGDGNLENNNVKVSIHKRDTEVLRFIKSELKSTSPIKNSNNGKTPYAHFSISHRNLPTDLLKYGVCPNKTYIYHQPTFNQKYFGHYLRGLVDADGFIDIRFPKGHRFASCTDKVGKFLWLIEK